MNSNLILHKDLILNSTKLKSAQGSVFFVKHKLDESHEDEKLVECILKIVKPFNILRLYLFSIQKMN